MAEIVIANTAEAFAPLLDRAGAASDRAMHESDLAGRALFWGGAEKIVVTPGPISPLLVERTAVLLNLDRLEVWHPARSSHRLCADILADADLLSRLRDAAAESSPVRILPYAITPEFCSLCEQMGWGSWRTALSAAVELDSKAGFRRIFAGTELALPQGYICSDMAEVAAAVYALARQERSIVLKVHNGESGWGLRFVDSREVSTRSECEALVRSLFQSDPVWALGPYIVEEFIAHDRSDPGFSPSGEATVDDAGVHFDYLCDQVMYGDGEFAGVCIGGDCERSQRAHALRRQTLLVGEVLRAKSYRGSFDVDFIVNTSGRIFAVESNVRMTGGTHVVGAARGLFGERWIERSFVSNDCIRYGPDPMPAPQLVECLAPMLLRRGEERGIVISFISACRPVLGAIAVAPDRADAIGQLEAAEQLLQCASENP